MKKILKTIVSIIFIIIILAFVVFANFIALAKIFYLFKKFILFIGFNSIWLGIALLPFWLCGIVQIFRGLLAIIDSDVNKINESSKPGYIFLYFPLTIFSCIVVISTVIALCSK